MNEERIIQEVLIAISNEEQKKAIVSSDYENYQDWNVDGIIVRDENVDFMISLQEVTLQFSDGPQAMDSPDIRIQTALKNAKMTDLDGEFRTQFQLNNHTDVHTEGCAICEAIKYGYLPSAGELQLIYSIKDQINELLEVVNGTAIGDSKYWSSTQFSNEYMWDVDMSNGEAQFWNSKTEEMSVRALKNANEYNKEEE